jgi:dipeptidyl aminopeptidase/acylaminoacyl peptidase
MTLTSPRSTWDPGPERIALAGTDLNALLFRPPDAASSAPAILSHPGGGLRPEDYEWLHYPLAAAGFVVLALYQRGLGSGPDHVGPPPSSDYAGPIQQNDALSALEAMAALDGVDSNRLGMVGHSLGAFITLIVASKTTKLRAVSALSTIDDTAEHMNRVKAFLPDIYERWGRFIGGTPEENPEAHRVRSPLAHVRGITAAVQLVTGANDWALPSHESATLANALQAQGNQVDLVKLDGAGHFFDQVTFRTFRSYTPLVAAHVIRWFRRTV